MPIKYAKQHGMSFTQKAMLTALAVGGIGAVSAMHPTQHIVHADSFTTNVSANTSDTSSQHNVSSNNVTPTHLHQAPQLGSQLGSHHLLGDSNNNSNSSTPGSSSSSAGNGSSSSTGGSPSGNGGQQQQGSGNGTNGGGNGTHASGNGTDGGGNGSPANDPNNSNNPNNGQPNNSNPNNDDPNNVVVPGHHGGHTSNNNNVTPSGSVVNNNDANSGNGNYAPDLADDHQYATILSSLVNGEDRDNQDALTRLDNAAQSQADQVAHEATIAASNSAAAVSAAEQGENQLQVNSMNQQAAINKVTSQIALNKQLQSLSASADSTKTNYMNMMASAEATANSQAMDAMDEIESADLTSAQRQSVLEQIQAAENNFVAGASSTKSPSADGLTTDLNAFISHIKTIINTDSTQNAINSANATDNKKAADVAKSSSGSASQSNENGGTSNSSNGQTGQNNNFQNIQNGTQIFDTTNNQNGNLFMNNVFNTPEEQMLARDLGYDFNNPESPYDYHLLRQMGINPSAISSSHWMTVNNQPSNKKVQRHHITAISNAMKHAPRNARPLTNIQRLIHDDQLSDQVQKNTTVHANNVNNNKDTDSDANAYANQDDYTAGYKAAQKVNLAKYMKHYHKSRNHKLPKHIVSRNKSNNITNKTGNVINQTISKRYNNMKSHNIAPRLSNISSPRKITTSTTNLVKSGINHVTNIGHFSGMNNNVYPNSRNSNGAKQTISRRLPKTGESSSAANIAALALTSLGLLSLAAVDIDRKYN